MHSLTFGVLSRILTALSPRFSPAHRVPHPPTNPRQLRLSEKTLEILGYRRPPPPSLSVPTHSKLGDLLIPRRQERGVACRRAVTSQRPSPAPPCQGSCYTWPFRAASSLGPARRCVSFRTELSNLRIDHMQSAPKTGKRSPVVSRSLSFNVHEPLNRSWQPGPLHLEQTWQLQTDEATVR